MTNDTSTANYPNIAAVKRANDAAGFHFFEPGTLGFFSSRIGRTLYGGRFFVTSEQFQPSSGPAFPRGYTIREALPGGRIRTVGEFQEFATEAAATAAVRAMLTS